MNSRRNFWSLWEIPERPIILSKPSFPPWFRSENSPGFLSDIHLGITTGISSEIAIRNSFKSLFWDSSRTSVRDSFRKFSRNVFRELLGYSFRISPRSSFWGYSRNSIQDFGKIKLAYSHFFLFWNIIKKLEGTSVATPYKTAVDILWEVVGGIPALVL